MTDHEWRLKMAAEGRAFYRPGRSAEEVRAELSAPDRETITLTITLRQARALETAVVDLPELTYHAAAALDTLAAAMSVGSLDGNDLMPILALFARGLKSAETKEIAALEAFDPVLRKALSQHQSAKTEAQSNERTV